MERENTIKESLFFCLFGTTEQRKISLDLIEKCLNENGIDISKCESQNSSTSDEALHIDDVVQQRELLIGFIDKYSFNNPFKERKSIEREIDEYISNL